MSEYGWPAAADHSAQAPRCLLTNETNRARHLARQASSVPGLRSEWPYLSQPRFNGHSRTSSARGEQQLLEALELLVRAQREEPVPRGEHHQRNQEADAQLVRRAIIPASYAPVCAPPPTGRHLAHGG